MRARILATVATALLISSGALPGAAVAQVKASQLEKDANKSNPAAADAAIAKDEAQAAKKNAVVAKKTAKSPKAKAAADKAAKAADIATRSAAAATKEAGH